MKRKVLVYLIIIWLLPIAGMAQVDSTAADSLPAQSLPDTLVTSRPDTLQSDSIKVLFKIQPWKYHAPLQAHVAATDSTLRWQVWPSWTYKKNRDPGVISYRLGTIGRTNAQQIDAHGPKYQELYWEDIRLNDPVSGIANWNYIPHHKIETIYENNLGTVYQTKFYLRDYYLNRPLTELNYTESSFDTRSLEFMLSSNLSQKTNAEISYWNRRDGGAYNNSGITGGQIYARITHQLDRRESVKVRFLNNNYTNKLPFGYNLPVSGGSFIFDRFNTSAIEPSAESNRNSTILGINYYRRPADTTKVTNNLQAGIFTNTSKREVTYSADTTSYKVRKIGIDIRKWLQAGPLSVEGAASLGYYLNHKSATFDPGNWSLFTAEAKADLKPFSLIQINTEGKYRSRSDGNADYRLGADVVFSISDRVKLAAGLTTGTRMPTPQQLYWQANEFLGSADLQNEQIEEMHGTLEVDPSARSTFGIKTELKQIGNGIMVGADSTFANFNRYSSFANAAFFNYRSTHFEFSGSATLQQFGNFHKKPSAPLPVDGTQRIWFKGSAYTKGYLFNRATYVKAGLFGMISPQAYAPARYYPSLDFWQSSGSNFIPSFNRLDVDLSARIRSIMVLLRYENVLDDVVQQGYFETAGHPMIGRRFIFGIRVLFRN